MTDDDVEALRSRAPGEDDANPYADVDVSELPAWWRESIERFEEYGLRPYRPPRLADGELKHEVVADLEAEFGVEIRFVGIDATYGDDWTLFVDDEDAGPVARHRSTDGYTVFECTADELRERVRDAIGADGSLDQSTT